MMHSCGVCKCKYPGEGAEICQKGAKKQMKLLKNRCIQKKYGDKIVVVGGYDTNGIPGQPGVTDEIIEKEVKRMLDTYAPQGSFASMAFLLSDDPDPMAFVKNMIRISSFAEKYRYDYYK